ncbi:MAG TPA: OB-fold nucleic acid binding domain-containing protein, partial [Pirellulaceae bacterium]
EHRVLTAVGLADWKHGAAVRVAGLVLVRQRPGTAKGITFVTLEDETGTINLVVHQATWDKFYQVARRSPAWVVWGRLERKFTVTHVIARQLFDCGSFLQQTPHSIAPQTSRDFR